MLISSETTYHAGPSPVIVPTVGRVVWYTPYAHEAIRGSGHLAAIVAHVWSSTCVNLAVFDSDGHTHARTSVRLVHGGAERPAAGFCEWMPYQIGQAKAHADVGTTGEKQVMNDDIETEIQTKASMAPRVTPADIAAEIASEHYFIASDALQLESAVHVHKGGWILGSSQLLTICILQLVNGFTVTGESACASAANFDAEIGRKIARENAISKVWPLLGFRLRDKLAGAQA